MVCVYPGHYRGNQQYIRCSFVWLEALWFDKATCTEFFVTGTAKIINTDVAAAGTVELQKECTFWATWQHTSAFTEREVLFRQAAFVTIARKNEHVSLFDKLCVY